MIFCHCCNTEKVKYIMCCVVVLSFVASIAILLKWINVLYAYPSSLTWCTVVLKSVKSKVTFCGGLHVHHWCYAVDWARQVRRLSWVGCAWMLRDTHGTDDTGRVILQSFMCCWLTPSCERTDASLGFVKYSSNASHVLHTSLYYIPPHLQ